jgi:hypothetical protein
LVKHRFGSSFKRVIVAPYGLYLINGENRDFRKIGDGNGLVASVSPESLFSLFPNMCEISVWAAGSF